MSILQYFFILSFTFLNCTSSKPQLELIRGNNFELRIAPKQKAVLILFPCFPCDIENTKTEAKFLKDLDQEGITTLLLGVNHKLYLTELEKIKISNQLDSIFENNNLKNENIFIGGFSSGGNIAFLLANHLLEKKSNVKPSGVFAVDAPLDLEALYNGAKKDVKNNIHPDAVAEGNFIIELFEREMGIPNENIEAYKTYSPYLISCNSTRNLNSLTQVKTRFYCEPDLDWQLKNRQRSYEDLNAHKMEMTYLALKKTGSIRTEFIVTTNRGYRANGDRHPHSWNIVERESLVAWMLERDN